MRSTRATALPGGSTELSTIRLRSATPASTRAASNATSSVAPSPMPQAIGIGMRAMADGAPSSRARRLSSLIPSPDPLCAAGRLRFNLNGVAGPKKWTFPVQLFREESR